MPAPTNRPRLSRDVRDRMGVYKAIDDVPAKYRLANHEAAYAGRDVWAEFAADKLDGAGSKATEARLDKAGRYWTTHMDARGRHPALADPGHVESFLVAIRDGDLGRQGRARQVHTVYFEYYLPLEQFYSWLQFHADHPHVYHPVQMAAADGGLAAEVFDYKVDQNDKR